MRKCQCLLFELKRSCICSNIICMTVPLILLSLYDPFQCSFADHIETDRLIYNANQMTDFFI